MIFNAVQGGGTDELVIFQAMKGLSEQDAQRLKQIYKEKYGKIRGGLETDLYHELDEDKEELFKGFENLIPPIRKEYQDYTLEVSGIESEVAVAGESSITLNVIETKNVEGESYERPGTRNLFRILAMVYKTPGGKYVEEDYQGTKQFSVDLDEAGVYDIMIFVLDFKTNRIIPLRTKQKVESIDELGKNLMGKLKPESYSTFRLGLKLEQLEKGGGVTLDQSAGGIPYIKPGSYNKNPAAPYQKNTYQVVPTSAGASFKWYARQRTPAIHHWEKWKAPSEQGLSATTIFGETYYLIGTGSSVNIDLDMMGYLKILCVEYDKSGSPTGEFAEYTQYVFEGLMDAEKAETEYRNTTKAIKASETYIQKIKGKPVPVKTVL